MPRVRLITLILFSLLAYNIGFFISRSFFRTDPNLPSSDIRNNDDDQRATIGSGKKTMLTLSAAISTCMNNGDSVQIKNFMIKSMKLLNETIAKLLSQPEQAGGQMEDFQSRFLAQNLLQSVLDVNKIFAIVNENDRERFMNNYAILLNGPSKVRDNYYDQVTKYAHICIKERSN
ncbi:unnamed protein product [Adineta ricciae]|uniref:Uncharacterized protein n=1 Tax=Adineta ricciae TaxID=249248 RepID=A0A816AHD3_ADIRI|nr:unnamed protein product [Adineta ricciae]CAF1597645.1 unnamed protein product [Adineta ricciae]